MSALSMLHASFEANDKLNLDSAMPWEMSAINENRHSCILATSESSGSTAAARQFTNPTHANGQIQSWQKAFTLGSSAEG